MYIPGSGQNINDNAKAFTDRLFRPMSRELIRHLRRLGEAKVAEGVTSEVRTTCARHGGVRRLCASGYGLAVRGWGIVRKLPGETTCGIITLEKSGGREWMPRKIPAEDEFDVRENEVEHKPTGATWTAYPGRPEPANYRRAMLGSVLPNGDDYREHEVAEIAYRLLRDRLKK